MIKLTEGWGEPKKDSEGEDDGFKKKGEGVSPNSLLTVHSKWRPSNERSNKQVFLHPKTPALQANLNLLPFSTDKIKL